MDTPLILWQQIVTRLAAPLHHDGWQGAMAAHLYGTGQTHTLAFPGIPHPARGAARMSTQR